MRQCHSDFLPVCQSKNQPLLLELPAELPPVLADKEQVQQALINLLSNAHKFTPEGGTISLGAEVHGGKVRIELRTRMGNSREDIESIFGAFRQAEREDGPGARGTGLGLTITKRIVELHGGEIGVQSEHGRGSAFRVHLCLYGKSLRSWQPMCRTGCARAGEVSRLLSAASPDSERCIGRCNRQRYGSGWPGAAGCGFRHDLSPARICSLRFGGGYAGHYRGAGTPCTRSACGGRGAEICPAGTDLHARCSRMDRQRPRALAGAWDAPSDSTS